MKTKLILSILIFWNASCSSQQVEDKLYKNFKASIETDGSYSYFCVVKVKNLNTGKTREICTDGNFVMGAIHKEHELDYNNHGRRTARTDISHLLDRRIHLL